MVKREKEGEKQKNNEGCIRMCVISGGNGPQSCWGFLEQLCRTCFRTVPLKDWKAQMFTHCLFFSLVESYGGGGGPLNPWHFQDSLLAGF